jgi:hypothetical protein
MPRHLTNVKFDGLTTDAAPLLVDVRPGTRAAAEFTAVTGNGAYRNPDTSSFTLTR